MKMIDTVNRADTPSVTRRTSGRALPRLAALQAQSTQAPVVSSLNALQNKADVRQGFGIGTAQMRRDLSSGLTPQVSNDQIAQLVLKNQANAKLNADLTDQYHEAEKSGDAISMTNRNHADQQTAADHYARAIRLRRQARKLHVTDDEGHAKAIAVLQTKKQRRISLIAEIKSGKKPKRPTLNWK